jgi:hypothetical protein
MVKVLNGKQAESKFGKKNFNYSDLIEYLFPVNILEKYADKLEGHWWRVSKYQRLTEGFMRKFEDKLNWEMVSQYQSLSEGFIGEFEGRVNWGHICRYQRLSEGFVRVFQDKVVWELISEYQRLTEDFMIDLKDKISWEKVSEHQTMSLDFIEEMWNKVDKKKVSEFQMLTERFIIKNYKHITQMSLNKIIEKVRLSESFLQHILSNILSNMSGFTNVYINNCLKSIVENQKISKEFCVRYSHVLPLKFLGNNWLISEEEKDQILTTVGILNKLA